MKPEDPGTWRRELEKSGLRLNLKTSAAKEQGLPGMMAYKDNLGLERQRQEQHHKIGGSLVYIVQGQLALHSKALCQNK